MKSGVKTTDHFKGLTSRVIKITRRVVLVGIPQAKATRPDDPITNAVIGYINEFGAPDANIPARPHLMPGVKDAGRKISAYLRQVGEAEFDGDSPRAERARHAAGLVAVNSVKHKITEGLSPELAPSTIAARRRRGRTGTKPLIDTGQYRNAITYVLRDDSGKASDTGKKMKYVETRSQ